MTNPLGTRSKDLNTTLVDSVDQLSKFQSVLDKTLQVLSKRGVQIMVDFGDMLRSLRQNLEKAQRNSQSLASELQQFQEMVNISAMLTSSLELDRVLEEVVDAVIRFTGAERAYLLLQQGTNLKIQVARNAAQQTIGQEDVTFSHGIIEAAISGAVPIITTNAQSDDRFQGMKSVIANDLRSVIIIPLMLKERVIGVLYADNRIEQSVFGQELVPLLTAFANQAAIAIANARQHEKIQNDLREAQQKVEMLQIEIDQKKLQEKVDEITETEYFRDLNSRAKELRQKRR